MTTGYDARPQPKKKSVLPWVLGCLGGGIAFCGIGGVIVIALLASGPQGGVRMANQIEPYAVEYIEKHGLLEEGESIVAYYDVTLTLKGTEAAILTDERLLYHKDGRTTEMMLDDVETIDHHKETLVGDVIEVAGGGQRMKIEIAPLNQGESFLAALRDQTGIE